jgi:diacylglycerol kinase (ATP)
MLLVLAMELANSAIEAVIERYGSEIHELAGRARTWARQRCSC